MTGHDSAALPRALLGVLLPVWALAGSAAGQCGYVSDRNTAAEPHPAFTRIGAKLPGGASYGTGTVIDWDGQYAYVVTCWHIFRGEVKQVTNCLAGRCILSAVFQTDPAADAAIVTFRAVQPPPMVTVGRDPRIGEYVWLGGWGDVGRWQWQRGRVERRAMPGQGWPEIYYFIPIAQARSGDSGGPVLNDAGQLVGIIIGADARETCILGIDYIRQRFAKHVPTWRPKQPAKPNDAAASPPPQQDATHDDGDLVPVGSACDPSGIACTTPPQATATDEPPPTIPQRPSVPNIPAASPRDEATDDDSAGNAATQAGNLPPPQPAPRPPAADAGCIADAVAESIADRAIAWAVAGAAGAAGVGLPAWAAWLAVRAMRYAAARRIARNTKTTAATTAEATPVILHADSPPPPPIVKRSREFVEVEVPHRRLKALQIAMDEFGRKYPGCRSTVETIESWADQIESGIPVKKGVLTGGTNDAVQK